MDDAQRRRFEAYVITRWSALLRSATLITQNAAVAEDVLQSAFVRLCSSWAKVERAQDPDAYVRRVIVNAAIDRGRKLPAETLTETPPEPSPADAASAGATAGGTDAATRLDLLGYLRALPARQRAVVVLRFYDDLSEAQTAAAMGISPGTVKSHTSRALSALRHQLTDEREAEPCL